MGIQEDLRIFKEKEKERRKKALPSMTLLDLQASIICDKMFSSSLLGKNFHEIFSSPQACPFFLFCLIKTIFTIA